MTLRDLLRPKNVADYTAELVASGQVATALDVGCGSYSHLSRFRPGVLTVGVDAHPEAIRTAERNDIHDAYVQADILKDDVSEVLAAKGFPPPFDLVSLYGVIEHLPRHLGFKILERCESLTKKYVILETPNGFVPQGPEFGNPFQRHLSGWFIHDFQSLGYRVFGTTGTRYLRGYMAEPTLRFPGGQFLEELATLLLRINRNPRHAFNLVAIKDIRGVQARHPEPPVGRPRSGSAAAL
jgi:2-polyprenyl-3-methyl-5-hydroxy-6-metoxy-1,4-benzoquinol methylase